MTRSCLVNGRALGVLHPGQFAQYVVAALDGLLQLFAEAAHFRV